MCSLLTKIKERRHALLNYTHKQAAWYKGQGLPFGNHQSAILPQRQKLCSFSVACCSVSPTLTRSYDGCNGPCTTMLRAELWAVVPSTSEYDEVIGAGGFDQRKRGAESGYSGNVGGGIPSGQEITS